ncbi:unnamed protein product [Mytilus coruscus]|uniref:Uncharacterized protein n=1 Tax=Mytilus coruscus TaxID=42192 RepID=A0A6J8CZ85_MYTCO|nr:unnamed protein product [Mytilus coruscus]
MNFTLKCQQSRNKHENELPYRTEPHPKTTEGKTQSQDEGKPRFYRIYNEIEKLRQEGDKNKKSAEMFAILVYIVLHGSSSVKTIDANIVKKIFKSIFHYAVSCDLLSIESCINDLTPRYLEQIGDEVTTREAVVSQAVICLFGNECFRCFVEICCISILFEHLLPTRENDKRYFTFDAYSIVLALINRLQCNPDVVHIGKHIRKLVNKKQNIEIVNIFLDMLNKSKKYINGIHMILFLDGLTSRGTNFTAFEKQIRFYELLYRKVDAAENVVFHVIVTHSVEYERLKLYTEYFCENQPEVMHIKNKSKLSPLHIAGFLGRIEIIGIFMCNSNERDEKLIGEIRSSVKSGIDKLKRLHSSKSDGDDVLKKVKLGEDSDYFCILDLIGNNVKETEEIDFSKSIGDSIVEVITDIKKGLNAFTKIPDILKTINKATKLKD